MGGVITVYLILRFYIKKLEELKKWNWENKK
jgi:hypothetical protein